jgi:fibronectin type 3 domain-containing protein
LQALHRDYTPDGIPNRDVISYGYSPTPSCAPKIHIEYTPPLQPPVNVEATDGAYTDRIRVTWDTASGATQYKVYRNTTNNPPDPASPLGTTSNLYYDDIYASQGTLYYYWVKSHNASEDSDFSSVDTGFVGVSPPAWIDATDGTYSNKIQITWTASGLASGYKVFRNTDNNPNTATYVGTTTLLGYDVLTVS